MASHHHLPPPGIPAAHLAAPSASIHPGPPHLPNRAPAVQYNLDIVPGFGTSSRNLQLGQAFIRAGQAESHLASSIQMAPVNYRSNRAHPNFAQSAPSFLHYLRTSDQSCSPHFSFASAHHHNPLAVQERRGPPAYQPIADEFPPRGLSQQATLPPMSTPSFAPIAPAHGRTDLRQHTPGSAQSSHPSPSSASTAFSQPTVAQQEHPNPISQYVTSTYPQHASVNVIAEAVATEALPGVTSQGRPSPNSQPPTTSSQKSQASSKSVAKKGVRLSFKPTVMAQIKNAASLYLADPQAYLGCDIGLQLSTTSSPIVEVPPSISSSNSVETTYVYGCHAPPHQPPPNQMDSKCSQPTYGVTIGARLELLSSELGRSKKNTHQLFVATIEKIMLEQASSGNLFHDDEDRDEEDKDEEEEKEEEEEEEMTVQEHGGVGAHEEMAE